MTSIPANDSSMNLLDRLRESPSPLAWGEFFERYWRAVFFLAKHLGCQDPSADDIVQEVMLTLFQGGQLFQFDPARGSFRDWLAAVVRNKVAQRRRGRAAQVRGQGGDFDAAPDLEAATPTAETAWEGAFEDALLATLLDIVRRETAAPTFQAFELAVLHDLPARQVAAVTGLSRNAVYKACARVTRRLQELGAAYGETGQLGERLKQALRASPSPAVQQSLTTRMELAMQARWESSR
jgi:RNA polymerase sigma-70 factor (ECF subfamily)